MGSRLTALIKRSPNTLASERITYGNLSVRRGAYFCSKACLLRPRKRCS